VFAIAALALTLSAAPADRGAPVPAASQRFPRDAAGTPGGAASYARSDTEELDPKDAPYVRYFWVAGDPKHRDDFLVAFCVHLNLLSVKGKIKWPVMIAPDVMRIDVRDYGWDAKERLKAFEKTAEQDYMFHQQAVVKQAGTYQVADPVAGKMVDKELKAGDILPSPAVWLDRGHMDYLRETLYTESPVLNAEWFFVQTCRQVSMRNDEEGFGYYDFLQLKTLDDYFALTGTDVKVAAKIARTWRAVVLDSGISEQNRQVIRFGSTAGATWGTLDLFKQKGKGVAERALRDGEFPADATEWFSYLPNGLPVMFLADAKGKAQATAPDKIGPDDSALNKSRDHRVHVMLSCIRCHGKKEMLLDVDDWARRTFRKGGVLTLADPDKKVALELESDYLRDIERLLKKDRADYSDAVREATTSKLNPKGLTVVQFTKLYGEAYNRYTFDKVTVEVAAREMGVAPKAFLDAVKAFGKSRGISDNALSTFLVSKTGMRRLTWEDTYALATSVSMGLRPPEEVEEKKVKPAFEKREKE
jgi:hypothetical protein